MSGIRRRVIATNAEHLDGLNPIRCRGNVEIVVIGDRRYDARVRPNAFCEMTTLSVDARSA